MKIPDLPDWAWWALGGVALGGLAFVALRPSKVDDNRPIIVTGDSYGVGIAAALRRMYPGRQIEDRALGGRRAATMTTLKDDQVFHLVSAGTNDVATGEPAAETERSILKLLGPYGDGTAKQGAAWYLLPHAKMGGQLGARVTVLRNELDLSRLRFRPSLALTARDRLVVHDPELEPAAGDKIHFSPEQYEELARIAMRELVDAS